MSTPEYRVKVLEAEVDFAKEYLESLRSEDLQKLSACENWTVADVVAHMVGQDFALRVTRGLQGDISPPEGAPSVADHDEDRFAQNISDRAKSTNERHGGQLVEVFSRRLDETVAVFAAVNPTDWDKLCYWPPGPEPVRTLLDLRIAELTMHIWDIRSVVDQEYHLSDDSIAVLTETVNRAVRRAFRPDPSLQEPLRYRFVIAGPIGKSVDIVLAGNGARVEMASEEAAEVIFRCDGETFVLVMFGRLKPELAVADGRLTAEGDLELASGFGRRFVGG